MPLRILAEVPPLEPDQPTGREWVLEELTRSEYAQARPNAIEVLFSRIWEWLRSLLEVDASGVVAVNPLLLLIALLVVASVIALIVLGRPRAVAGRASAPASVFLDDDERSAAELRAAAERAAGADDWALAITERFRALSRSLSDRTSSRCAPAPPPRASRSRPSRSSRPSARSCTAPPTPSTRCAT